MKPWRAILAALVIFVAGLLSGVLASHLYRAKNPQPPPAPFPGGPPMPGMGFRMELMRRMGDRLQLSPEQRERIDRYVQESQQRMRELWQPVEPKAQAELKRLREQIEAELSPEQREALERFFKERPSRGPGDGSSWHRRDGRPDGRPEGGTNVPGFPRVPGSRRPGPLQFPPPGDTNAPPPPRQ